jgi:glycine dehydrogenase
LAAGLSKLGYKISNELYFDTLRVELGNHKSSEVLKSLVKRQINVRAINENTVSVSLDETTTEKDLASLYEGLIKYEYFILKNHLGFAEVSGKKVDFTPLSLGSNVTGHSFGNLARTSQFLTHPVFNKHHSETEMMRYIKYLENKDLSLANCMIPLGSCTMKLNAAAEMIPVTWPEFASLHPFVPLDQAQGYMEMFDTLSKNLAEVTRFHAVSLQPNAGSQGNVLFLETHF